MISRRAAIASSLVLVLSAALVVRADEPKIEGDLKLLQGDWITKDEGGNESKWTFKGDKVLLKAQPGDREYTMTIKLDDKAKPDKTIDFAVSDDSPKAKGFKSPGIYKFDGDKKATFCFSADGNTRPKEYKTDLPNSVSVELVKK